MWRFSALALVLCLATTGCPSDASIQPTLTAIDPPILDPIGGSRLRIVGRGLAATTGVSIGGVAVAALVAASDTELSVVTAPTPVGEALDVVVTLPGSSATLAGAAESWSPAELPGARLFDANAGVKATQTATTYEWQRLTENIGDGWRVRDGNTLTWLPSTNRFWMVAGWNGLQQPLGFDPDGPELGEPLIWNTTTEVWSSPDGVAWTLEVPDMDTQFERRHAHSAVLFRDRLWLLGGDHHQGWYNHDVVSSSDGVHWKVELGTRPGQTPPPWSPRALQTAGVFDGKLWMAGGQDLVGDEAQYQMHNDVWSSSDGVTWQQVVADAPPSSTRWQGCSMVSELVEFHGRMWLVGCGRYQEALGTLVFPEVWSTTDGASWTRHQDPPWNGRNWHSVVAWDDKLWVIAGYSYGGNGWPGGNTSETWYSEDGETWTAMALDRCQQPASHAQGVAVREDGIYFAGGNYTFGGNFSTELDKSTWRLRPFRGESVEAWTARGSSAVEVRAAAAEDRPVRDPNALGPGIAGLQFDGSTTALELGAAKADLQPDGRSVFFVARAPFVRSPPAWDDTFNPVGTVVGGEIGEGGVYPSASLGLTDGQLVYVNREKDLDAIGGLVWSITRADAKLQIGAGEVRLAGVTHGSDGKVQLFVDGVAAGTPGMAYYDAERGWSRIGGGMGQGPLAVDNRFAGSLGAVIILPSVADAATVAKLHQWARGRFLVR